MILDIFTGELGQINFEVTATNNWLRSNTSKTVSVNITYNCTFDQITHNFEAPNATERFEYKFPDELKFIDVELGSNATRLYLNVSTEDYRRRVFNIRVRIVNNASKYCNLTDFAIT